MTKNESFLIKELLPIWKKYADGFVFLDDGSTDDTVEYLKKVKDEYNILEIIQFKRPKGLLVETDTRQLLFDTGLKYSNKIICLDTDEYLDGSTTKEQFETFLDKMPDTVFYMQWIQYTGKNERRIDSFWNSVFHDRLGHYTQPTKFPWHQTHSPHCPPASKAVRLDPKQLFVAHLQWLDKKWVGVKQYYWKVTDFVNKLEYCVKTIDSGDYDVSVNNFNWQYEKIDTPLKIREDIYKIQDLKKNFKLEYIKEQTKKYCIPNLGDWGLGIHDYCIKD